MRRLIAVMGVLIALVGLLSSPTVIAAGGALHFSGSGDAGTGSRRVLSDVVPLPCFGISADFGDYAEVTITGQHWVDKLVVDGAGHAHFRLIVRDFTYAVYPARDLNLPTPGDPGFLFIGSVAAATIETTLDSLTPDAFGTVSTRVSIPIRMHSADGSQMVHAFYDVLIVVFVDSGGTPFGVGSAPLGGRCP